MRLISRIFSDPNQRRAQQAALVAAASTPLKPRDLYALLKAFYLSNGLYDQLSKALYDQAIWQEALKPLRNPAYRVVEFYASHLWPGTLPDALPIETANDRIIPAIQQVWTWSNWASQKQVTARWLAIYGDLFIKIVQREDRSRVYFQLIEPEFVSQFDTDERGFLTYIRLDVPQTRRDGDTLKPFTHTEVWDKENDRFRVWEHDKAADAPLDQLPAPVRADPISSFGIDFIPFVHIMFRDIGEDRGMGAFTHAIDKIDEANRLATRLHQMLFRHNKVLWALRANAMDASGRPLPAPRIGDSSGTSSSDTIELGDDRLLRLPGTSELQSLVPNINYDAALNVLNAHMLELEKDLPELAYYRLREMTTVSGRAVRLLLSDAIDRVLEARGNAEASLIRADQMALTIAVNAGLFQDIGRFESGDFEHTFRPRDVLPSDDLEKAQADKAAAEAALLRQQLGVSSQQLQRELGYSQDQIDQMAQEREATTADLGQQMLRNFDRGGA